MTDDFDDSPPPMVLLGEHLAMPLPEPEFRSRYNVGEHRMVRVLFGGDDLRPEYEDWMCFDHGPGCWTTLALLNYLP